VLVRLGETVKRQLLPQAESAKLRAELQALASVLRLAGATSAGLGATPAEAQHREALVALSLIDSVPSDVARSQLAEASRAVDDFESAEANAILSYIESDVRLGTIALVDSPVAGTGDIYWRDEPRPALCDAASRPAVQTALRAILACPDLVLTSCDAAADGFAADTAIVHLTGTDLPATVVVRAQWRCLLRELIHAPSLQKVAIAQAAGVGLAVPTVLAAADDAPPLDTQLLVTSFVKGSAPAVWTREGRQLLDRVRECNGWQPFLENLARLHQADVRPVEARLGPASATSRLLTRLGQLEEAHRRACLRPDPLIEFAFAWLGANVDCWGETVVIHGDYRPGNVIYTPQCEVAAIVDWDLATAADFHEDVATLVSLGHRDREGRACGLLPPERMLYEYRRASGRAVDPVALAYHRVLQTVRQLVALEAMARSWYDAGGDVRLARALFSLAEWRRELYTALRAEL
jgi:aminoglycoside phosphotransferase (APT) family kinase protein